MDFFFLVAIDGSRISLLLLNHTLLGYVVVAAVSLAVLVITLANDV